MDLLKAKTMLDALKSGLNGNATMEERVRRWKRIVELFEAHYIKTGDLNAWAIKFLNLLQGEKLVRTFLKSKSQPMTIVRHTVKNAIAQLEKNNFK